MDVYDKYLLSEYQKLGSIPELKVAIDYYKRTHTKPEMDQDVEKYISLLEKERNFL